MLLLIHNHTLKKYNHVHRNSLLMINTMLTITICVTFLPSSRTVIMATSMVITSKVKKFIILQISLCSLHLLVFIKRIWLLSSGVHSSWWVNGHTEGEHDLHFFWILQHLGTFCTMDNFISQSWKFDITNPFIKTWWYIYVLLLINRNCLV